jgi:hypothetical protein
MLLAFYHGAFRLHLKSISGTKAQYLCLDLPSPEFFSTFFFLWFPDLIQERIGLGYPPENFRQGSLLMLSYLLRGNFIIISFISFHWDSNSSSIIKYNKKRTEPFMLRPSVKNNIK